MATTRMTFGSVTNTVVNAANAVGEIFDGVGNGARYANNFVKKALSEQEKTYAVDAEDFTSKLIETRTMQTAERYAEIDRYCSDPENKRRYDAARERMVKAIQKVDPDYEG